jgi:nitrogen fixation NifU-like protein
MIYTEVLLEHARRPQHDAPVDRPTASGSAHNALCGDHVQVELRLDEGRVAAVRVQTRGCAVAVAAGSLAGDVLLGRTPEELTDLSARWLRALHDPSLPESTLPGQLTPTFPVLAVRGRPSRRRCAALVWEALAHLSTPSP